MEATLRLLRLLRLLRAPELFEQYHKTYQ